MKFDLLRLSYLRILLSETCRGVSPPSTPSFSIEPNRVSLSTGQSARRQHGRRSAVSNDRSLYLWDLATLIQSSMILSVVVVPETAESPSPSRAASPANGTKRRHSSVSEQGGKRPRLSTEESNGYRRESITSSTAPERKAERRRSGQTEVNAVERKRGQRLFGAMLGALSQRSPTTAQKRRADIEKKQQDKLKQQAEEFNQMKRERREKLLAMRREEQKKFDEESVRVSHPVWYLNSDIDWLDADSTRKHAGHGPLPPYEI